MYLKSHFQLLSLWSLIFSFLVFLLHYSWQTNGACEDLDTAACILMKESHPDLCQEQKIASTACAKFCNLCNLTCYDCATISLNATDCTTTRECAHGEQCFLAKFHSAVDDHFEYKMNCGSLEHCEGRNYLNLLGRDVDRRTISTECCSTDLCNTPAFYMTTTPVVTSSTATKPAVTTPTTSSTVVTETSTTSTMSSTTTSRPACARDIDILIEDSRNQRNTDTAYIVNFLTQITQSIQIGRDASMMAISTFDRTVNISQLQTSWFDVNQQINGLHFSHAHSYVDMYNVLISLKHRGDTRPHVDNVLVILLDTSSYSYTYTNPFPFPDFFQTTSASFPQVILLANTNVIVIGVGRDTLKTYFAELANDHRHVVTFRDYHSLDTFNDEIVALICA